MRTFVVVVCLVAACSKGDKKNEGAGSGSAVTTGSAATPADAAVVTPDAAVAAFFPEKRMGEKEGIILAEKQGGVVDGIPDGTKVEVVDVKEIMVGSQEDGEVTIKANGKELKLRPTRVLIANAMHYSPDKKHVVFMPVMACGDICHTELWLVSADGRRTQLGEGTVDYYDAWNGDTLAVSAGVLWVVSLAAQTAKKFDDYMSPSFSPENVLYVRGEDGSAYTLIDGKAKRVYKAPKHEAGEDEDPYSVDGPPPVKWKGGKPNYSTSFLPDEMQ